MNNEEKILALLGQIGGDVASLKSDVTYLKDNITILTDDVTSLKDDFTSLKSDVSILKDDVTSLKGDVSTLKGDVTSLKGDVSTLKDDVTSLKSDVSILKDDVAALEIQAIKIEVTQENLVLPQLETLSEGHKVLLDTLCSKSRVDALDDDLSFMKTVIKSLSQEIDSLKKAQ